MKLTLFTVLSLVCFGIITHNTFNLFASGVKENCDYERTRHVATMREGAGLRNSVQVHVPHVQESTRNYPTLTQSPNVQ